MREMSYYHLHHSEYDQTGVSHLLAIFKILSLGFEIRLVA